MTLLITGLILFLGIHSSRIFADNIRLSLINKLGASGRKGVYSLIALVGFVFII